MKHLEDKDLDNLLEFRDKVKKIEEEANSKRTDMWKIRNIKKLLINNVN